jgi:hypothetical protein
MVCNHLASILDKKNYIHLASILDGLQPSSFDFRWLK